MITVFFEVENKSLGNLVTGKLPSRKTPSLRIIHNTEKIPLVTLLCHTNPLKIPSMKNFPLRNIPPHVFVPCKLYPSRWWIMSQ